MLCSKEQYIEANQPNDTEDLCNQVMSGKFFRFLQVDIHVPDELIDNSVNSVHCLSWTAFQMNRFEATCMSTRLKLSKK